MVALNRAVAIAQVKGPRAALAALDEIDDQKALANYHLYYAVAGQLWLDAAEPDKAAFNFRRALELAALPSERLLLEKRLSQCEG